MPDARHAGIVRPMRDCPHTHHHCDHDGHHLKAFAVLQITHAETCDGCHTAAEAAARTCMDNDGLMACAVWVDSDIRGHLSLVMDGDAMGVYDAELLVGALTEAIDGIR